MFLSIPTTVKHQPGKANIVADTLVWSERPIAKDIEEATSGEEIL